MCDNRNAHAQMEMYSFVHAQEELDSFAHA
jgi:hypothetical protein